MLGILGIMGMSVMLAMLRMLGMLGMGMLGMLGMGMLYRVRHFKLDSDWLELLTVFYHVALILSL